MPRVRPVPAAPAGHILALPHRSEVLVGNPWDDPTERVLNVYLPPAYDESGPPLVALWDLAAFTNSGPGHLNWRHHGESLPQRLDRLIGAGELPPVVVPMPDCFTSLGGNQYLNSPGVGAYADYLVGELVPLLSREVNVIDDRSGRGAFGKSSGGYGALRLAMDFPDTWGAVASHAGDLGFDWVYRPSFPLAATALRDCGGDPLCFLERFWTRRKRGQADYAALLTLAMAATYDPDPAEPANIRLPFDLETCTLDPERWGRWLAHDPLQRLDEQGEALQRLHALYIDVGSRDEYHIQYGTRRFARELEKRGVDHHFEEFDGTHMGLDWRLDRSLPVIANALYAASEDEPR
ncbi:MAG: enterochelin esterase [Xanthomonadales bacterium]|nr:enterochelin esterase [Xanthomonadales bacterium]